MIVKPEPELHKRQLAFTAWNQLPGADRKKWGYEFEIFLAQYVPPVKKENEAEEGEAIVE